MDFRPCIDIHMGKVKQIIGSSINCLNNNVIENYVSDLNSTYYALLYKQYDLKGAHVIMLDPSDATAAMAIHALSAWPDSLQVGGGISESNCKKYIDSGASHVIVTSMAFTNTDIAEDRLKRLTDMIGKKHVVIDMSCISIDGSYRIVTDKWRNITDLTLSDKLFDMLRSYCDEFLVHAVSLEGKKAGIDRDLIELLSNSPIPVTYAGGISCYNDVEDIYMIGKGNVNFTVGSCLDIFGGNLEFETLADIAKKSTGHE